MIIIPSLYIYNFIFLVICFLLVQIKVISKKFYTITSIGYFIFIFGQRWYGGVDFPFYLKAYLFNSKVFEIGYLFIQSLFFKYNIYFGNLIFLIYLFTTLTSVWFLKKYSYSNCVLFLFFLTEYHIMSINPLRTYIAINFFLIGHYFYTIKNKKIGIFIMGIGILFHKLAVGAILVFFIFKIIQIINYEKILLVYLLIIPMIDVREILKKIVFLVFPSYLGYFGGEFNVKLSLLNQLRYYIILVLFLGLKKYMNKKIKKEKIILEGIYIFFILIGTAVSFGPLHRIAYFFKIFEFIFFAYIFDFKKIKKLKKILIIFIFLINYLMISYKDLGVLFDYKLKFLQFYNTKSKEEYLKEKNIYLEKYYKK